MRRRFFINSKYKNNEIWYTSSDGAVITPYKSDVFGANIVSNTYTNGKGVITFNGKVTSIGDEAFSGCESLASITIPNSVTSIGSYAFSHCSSLTSITISNSVTSIGSSAFSNCTSLTSITIPDSVISIGNYGFSNCTSLTSVYCKPTTPPTGGGYMFNSNASNRIIYVPTASVNAYKAKSYWSNYASYIQGYNF